MTQQGRRSTGRDIKSHSHAGWDRANSLLVGAVTAEQEGLGWQVQAVYLDTPCGARCGSNLQPFVSRGEVTDGQDQDLTGKPEPIRTLRDVRNLGTHGIESFNLRDLGA
ncbi:MAG: hypothetical protein OXC01_17915 [Immundisolibacterales bacterium]|nr:hypothetical protein [Immundisolibacterales bacterium]